MKNKEEQLIHWADQKEIIKSNKPLLLAFRIIKHAPDWVITAVIFLVGFFYTLTSRRARIECRFYQKQLKKYTDGKAIKHVNVYKQILSFCFCVIEKMQSWLGRIKYDRIIFHEGMEEFQKGLDSGKGALLIGSHLGNIELLRGMVSSEGDAEQKEISVTSIMELKSTEMFNRTLQEVNPKAGLQIIDPSSINPGTIIELQEKIEKGGIVVITADRTSARSRNRVIREKFLGREADFPYGVFVLASLLKAPTYFIFGLREKETSLNSRYHMFVEKSEVDFNCGRSERDNRLRDLCREFVSKLEKYCKMFPYQWYNFYNFWLLQDEE